MALRACLRTPVRSVGGSSVPACIRLLEFVGGLEHDGYAVRIADHERPVGLEARYGRVTALGKLLAKPWQVSCLEDEHGLVLGFMAGQIDAELGAACVELNVLLLFPGQPQPERFFVETAGFCQVTRSHRGKSQAHRNMISHGVLLRIRYRRSSRRHHFATQSRVYADIRRVPPIYAASGLGTVIRAVTRQPFREAC